MGRITNRPTNETPPLIARFFRPTQISSISLACPPFFFSSHIPHTNHQLAVPLESDVFLTLRSVFSSPCWQRHLRKHAACTTPRAPLPFFSFSFHFDPAENYPPQGPAADELADPISQLYSAQALRNNDSPGHHANCSRFPIAKVVPSPSLPGSPCNPLPSCLGFLPALIRAIQAFLVLSPLTVKVV